VGSNFPGFLTAKICVQANLQMGLINLQRDTNLKQKLLSLLYVLFFALFCVCVVFVFLMLAL
jgi:hypothetical protein